MIPMLIFLFVLAFLATSIVGLVTMIRWIMNAARHSTPANFDDQNRQIEHFEAAGRVIELLRARQILEPEQLDAFEQAITRLRIVESEFPPAAPPPNSGPINAAPNQNRPPQIIGKPDLAEAAESAESEIPVAVAVSMEDGDWIDGDELVDDLETVAAAEETNVAAIAPPTPTRRGIGDAVATFMERHNIRIVEIVAGLLIVVSSIGLVVSLWHTLMTTHRVVPAVIFISANAALFAAAFYVFSKWRLPQTGRAMLVIATLLVPLSIIASMAGGGRGEASPNFFDPLTLAVIIGGGALYSRQLWIAGQILVGRRHAWRWMTMVAAAAATIIFMPTVADRVGQNAGWLMTVAAIATALCWIDFWPKRKSAGALNLARGIGLLLPTGLAMVAAATGHSIAHCLARSVQNGAASIQNAAIPSEISHVYLSIAIVLVPLIILASQVALAIINEDRQRQISSGANARRVLIKTAAVISFVGTLAIFPAFLISPSWAIVYAGVWSTSMAGIVWLGGSSVFCPLATIPLGLVAMLTVPHVFGVVDWSQPWIARIVCDSSIIITAAFAVICLLAARTHRDRIAWTKPWSYAAIAWATASGVLLLGWCVQSDQTIRMLPAVIPSALMWMIALAGVGLHRRMNIPVQFGATAISLALLSSFHLITIALQTEKPWIALNEITFAPTNQWFFAVTTLAGLIGGWVFWIEKDNFINRSNEQESIGNRINDSAVRLATIWNLGATASIGIGVYSWWIDHTNIAPMLIVLLGCSVVLWQSTRYRMPHLMGHLAGIAAILSSAGTAGLELREVANWQFPAPWFAVSIAIAITTSFWNVVNRHHETPSSKGSFSLGHAVAALSIGVIVMWLASWASIVLPVTIVDHQVDHRLMVIAMVVCGAAQFAFRRSARFDPLIRIFALVSVAGFAMTIGQRVTTTPLDQMMIATIITIVTWTSAAIYARRDSQVHWTVNVTLALSLVVTAISVGVVVQSDWLPAVGGGDLTPATSTCFISGVILWLAVIFVAHSIRLGKSAHVAESSNIADRFWGRAGGMLFLMSVAFAVPLFSLPSPFTWWHITSISAAAVLLIGRMTMPPHWRSTLGAVANDLGHFSVITGVVASAAALMAILVDQPESWMCSTICLIATTAGLVIAIRKFRLPISVAAFLGSGVAAGWLSTTFGSSFEFTPIDCLAAQWAIILLGCISVWLEIDSVAEPGPTFRRRSNVVTAWIIASLTTFIAIVHTAIWLDYLAVAVWSVVAFASIRWEWLTPTSTRLVRLSRGSTLVAAVTNAILILSQFPINDSLAIALAMTWLAGLVGAWRITRLCLPTPVHRQVSSMVCDSLLVAAMALFMCMQCGLLIVSMSFSSLEMNHAMITLVATSIALLASPGRIDSGLRRESLLAMAIFASAAVVIGRSFMDLSSVSSFWPLATLAALGVAIWWTIGTLFWKPLSRIDRSLRKDENQDLMASMVQWIPFSTICIGAWSGLVLFDNPSRSLVVINLCMATVMTMVTAINGDIFKSQRNRVLAIVSGMATTLGWTMIGLIDDPAFGLLAAVRVAVVGSMSCLVFTWVLPWFAGKTKTSLWSLEFDLGRRIAVVAATGGLLAMLLGEWLMRSGGVVSAIDDSVVIGVGVWMAISSLALFAMAVLGGPVARSRRLPLSPGTRKMLIFASQGVAVATWVHIYLCRQSWATSGLSAQWPWIVLAIASVSVIATAMARRFGDDVIGETLSLTSLYLPLIPALGFWATKSTVVLEFLGSQIPTGDGLPYRLILLVVAIYYVAVPSFWKKTWPRLAAMGFGTVALWLHLSQSVGWAFFAHPQAWLVPPAIGVLAMTQWEQKRLDRSVQSALRYAATLTIYVTSTADMIYAGLGTSITGPIVLIILSLAGIAAGIALRVGPLLHLGALFLFVATTGMVFHAGQSLDAVWPWWAFGIGTGIAVLAGLIAMERYRPEINKFIESFSPHVEQ